MYPEEEPIDLEAMLRGEVADPFDVEAMTSLGYDLVEDAKVYTHQRIGIVAPQTDAELDLQTTWYEDGADLGKQMVVGIGRIASSEHAFQVSFDFNNNPTNPIGDKPEEFAEGMQVLREFLDSDQTEIHEFANYLFLYMQRLQMGEVAAPLPDPDLSTHPVEMAKQFVQNHQGKKGVEQRVFKAPLSADRGLIITKHTVVGLPEDFLVAEDGPDEEQQLWLNMPRLRIRLTEESGMVMREFLSLQDGRYGIATGFCVGDDLFDLDGEEVDEEDKEYNVIRTNDLGILTDALMEVRMAKQQPERAIEDWVYPELPFAFNVWPGDTAEDLVKAAMLSLQTTAKYILPERCPDGFPVQPNYQYNLRKLNRASNYLTHKVSSPITEESERRHKIVNIADATEVILDELAKENHPVAQMIAALHYDYSDKFTNEEIQSVAIEVVTLTHWEQLRAALAEQSDRWRMFGSATINALPIEV